MTAAEFVDLPGGTVTLLDARRRTQRTVTLEPFSLARTPVTVEQFRASVDGDRRPAHGVAWHEAVAWCNARSRAELLEPVYRSRGGLVVWDPQATGYRLPTESEWQFACGPAHDPSDLASVAWTAADDMGGPQPVARKQPNQHSIHDLLGNVWEWCWDYADPARYRDYRVLRGGGWADRHWSVRPGARRASAPDAVLDDVGFRLARGVVGTAHAAQGWSAADDRARADIRTPLPLGWTPLRELLD